MISQEKTFNIIYKIAQGFIPIEDLTSSQVSVLEQITCCLCDCPQCVFTALYQIQDENFESHVDMNESRIYLSRQVFKVYSGIEEPEAASNAFLLGVLIQIILRSVLSILDPESSESQLTEQALNWLNEYH